MATQEIDLESLFNDPKNMVNDFNADFPMQSEVNEALVNALAEINENQRIVAYDNREQGHQYSADISLPSHNLKTIYSTGMMNQGSFPDQLEIKPLTPESLLNDDSHISSPNDLFSSHGASSDIDEIMVKIGDLSRSQVKTLKAQNASLYEELEKYKKLLDSRTVDLRKSMNELKKSEVQRLELMKENRDLKKIVRKLALNEQQNSY